MMVGRVLQSHIVSYLYNTAWFYLVKFLKLRHHWSRSIDKVHNKVTVTVFVIEANGLPQSQ